MANVINATSTGNGGLVSTGDDSGILNIQTNETTAITVDASQNVTFNSTGAITLTSGTTAQRPASPVVGMIRYNTSTSYYEVYTSAGWAFLSSTSYDYNIEYLVVAGGAGGGNDIGGGGGAGGYRTASGFTISGGTTYTITVGAGGAAVTNGSNSVFGSITSTAGGAGATLNGAGSAGGSGGGSGGRSGSGGAGNTPSTSPSQGNAGGTGLNNAQFPCGGGGGAGGVGGNASGTIAGSGGVGLQWPASSGTYYAGGGGGSTQSGGTGGAAGLGGGGVGGTSTNSYVGTAGTANTGGGGGAGGYGSSTINGANGGSGIVRIRYTGAQIGSGGSVTTSDGYTIHTFISSGTFTA